MAYSNHGDPLEYVGAVACAGAGVRWTDEGDDFAFGTSRHPLGVKAFSYRRVKNDQSDAADLADLLRMGRLPHAWIAPPETRELRELVWHRAKLVAMRSRCKAEVHAVAMPAPYNARIASLCRLVEALDFEIDLFAGLARGRLARDPGYTAVQQIPGIGPVLAAVFVAEIGDVHRFGGPAQLTCWAGLTPRHHESDTTVHRCSRDRALHRPIDQNRICTGTSKSGVIHTSPTYFGISICTCAANDAAETIAAEHSGTHSACSNYSARPTP